LFADSLASSAVHFSVRLNLRYSRQRLLSVCLARRPRFLASALLWIVLGQGE